MISPSLIIPPLANGDKTHIKKDWFRVQTGKYVQVEPNTKGIIYSQAFPELCNILLI